MALFSTFFLCFAKMFRKKYMTQTEIEAWIEAQGSDDEEETAALIRHADNVDLVVLPPSRVDEISDIEDIDEDTQILNDATSIMPRDVAGEIELVCEYVEGNVNMPNRPDDFDECGNDADSDDAPLSKRKKKSKPITYTAKWSKKKKVDFTRQPVDVAEEKVRELFTKYGLLILFVMPLPSTIYIYICVLSLRRRKILAN